MSSACAVIKTQITCHNGVYNLVSGSKSPVEICRSCTLAGISCETLILGVPAHDHTTILLLVLVPVSAGIIA